jgi:hypothetical protein
MSDPLEAYPHHRNPELDPARQRIDVAVRVVWKRPVLEWLETDDPKVIRFMIGGDITIPELHRFSELVGTDRINLDLGKPYFYGYSEATPSEPGENGYIEILL